MSGEAFRAAFPPDPRIAQVDSAVMSALLFHSLDSKGGSPLDRCSGAEEIARLIQFRVRRVWREMHRATRH
jgi:hypothetical protein